MPVVPIAPPQQHVEFVNETGYEIPFLYLGEVVRLNPGQGVRLVLPHPEDVAFRTHGSGPVVYRSVFAGAYRFTYSNHAGVELHRID